MRWILGLALLGLMGGCTTICPNPFDEQYGFEGGAWDRIDRCHGRVASEFSPEASSTPRRTSDADIAYVPLAPRKNPNLPGGDFDFDDLYRESPDPPPRPGVETRLPGQWIGR